MQTSSIYNNSQTHCFCFFKEEKEGYGRGDVLLQEAMMTKRE